MKNLPTTLTRIIRLPALAIASLTVLAACGGGGGSDRPPVQTNPDPVQPSPPPAPEPTLATTFTDLVPATSGNAPGWGAWTAPAGRVPVSGVACTGTITYHQHSLVSIYKEGTRLGLPDNLGRSGCTYELHTHDVMGMVHMEADVAKKFTLAQLFALWGQPLGVNGTAGLAGPVRFYLVDNEKLTRYTGDPAALELVPHREIVIVSGAAPAVLPKYRWPSGL